MLKGGKFMDEQQNMEKRPTNPRRKKRTKFQIFKEVYLPVIIAGIALIFILTFIIGSIVRAVQNNNLQAQLAQEESIAQQQKAEAQAMEAEDLLSRASLLAAQCDYDRAIEVINSFSGNLTEHANLAEALEQYENAKASLVLWNDPNQVLNLSFQPLIADSQRAFSDSTYGTSYNRNYVTTGEFRKILQQLYENGYILVRLSDITTENGPKDLYLPNGKKPLILTETHVNYNTYMIDGDGDKLPDKDGDGFASKLILDDNGNLACSMVNAQGETVTGEYDLVPILESFIETHPGFSYRGARAILALTGYDGVFGYRTSPAAEEFFGVAFHDSEVAAAQEIVAALQSRGYEFACYSYENEPYGQFTAGQIQAELAKWQTEVTPILGEPDIFVFCRNSDIAPNGSAYSDDKFQAIQALGFKYYLGFCENGTPIYSAHNGYIRQGRILVTGSNMAHQKAWFDGIFDPDAVLESARGAIPN